MSVPALLESAPAAAAASATPAAMMAASSSDDDNDDDDNAPARTRGWRRFAGAQASALPQVEGVERRGSGSSESSGGGGEDALVLLHRPHFSATASLALFSLAGPYYAASLPPPPPAPASALAAACADRATSLAATRAWEARLWATLGASAQHLLSDAPNATVAASRWRSNPLGARLVAHLAHACARAGAEPAGAALADALARHGVAADDATLQRLSRLQADAALAIDRDKLRESEREAPRADEDEGPLLRGDDDGLLFAAATSEEAS